MYFCICRQPCVYYVTTRSVLRVLFCICVFSLWCIYVPVYSVLCVLCFVCAYSRYVDDGFVYFVFVSTTPVLEVVLCILYLCLQPLHWGWFWRTGLPSVPTEPRSLGWSSSASAGRTSDGTCCSSELPAQLPAVHATYYGVQSWIWRCLQRRLWRYRCCHR